MKITVLKFLLGILALGVINASFAQENLVSGDWTTYLPKRTGSWVTQSEDKVIYSTARSILVFDKQDLSFEEITTVDGLSEAKINRVDYDKFNDQLFIIYNNSNIDVIKDGEILNIPFIKENQNIIGSREVLDLHFVNQETGFLATHFGIIQLNLKTLDFRSTTFTQLSVSSFTSSKGALYAGTEEGIYTIEMASSEIIDFQKWKLLDGVNGLPLLSPCDFLGSINDVLYAVVDNELYKSLGDDMFSKIEIDPVSTSSTIKFISDEGAHLLVGYRDPSSKSSLRAITANGDVLKGGADCINRVLHGIEDQQGRIWYADEWRGFRHTESIASQCNKNEYDSPFSFETSHIVTAKEKVYYASGGANENFMTQSNRNGIYINDKSSWKNIAGAFYKAIDQNNFLNFVTVAPHPSKDEIYMGSYWGGVAKFDEETEEFIFYNDENSSLQGTIGDAQRERVSYLKFDRDENLWISNYGAGKPISVLTKDGDWHSFTVSSTNKNCTDIEIDTRGYKWIAMYGNPGGLMVFDDAGTIADPSDDRYKYFTASNSEIPGNIVNCLAEDLDGSIWVGTNEGPVIFDCDPFEDDNCVGFTLKIVQDSVPARLLSDENIRAITIDGANRKWLGSKNGIFVQSASGQDQVGRFTIDNSPLLDNIITELTFEGETGLVYIGTNEGINAYKTETLAANKTHSSNVLAYPNPYRIENGGNISIKGLGRDANVKITDINGHLVHETKSLGGQVTWDGLDYNNQRAAPGVYLVFSSSQINFEKRDNYVTKFMILR